MRTSQPSAANAAATPAAGIGRTALGSATGQRLPVAPRERRPALAALAVLLILGGALTSAYLVMASGNRVSAIQIARPIAAGQPIPVDSLKEVQVGDTGIRFLRWSERFKVARSYAAVPLVPNTLLTNDMLTRPNDPGLGRLVVGLALKPGQYPAGALQNGRHVSLYAVGAQSSSGIRAGTVLSPDAIIVAISQPGKDSLRSDQTVVSVAVPPEQAAQVTQAASVSAVAVALLPAGTSAPAGGAQQARPGGKTTEQPAPTGSPGTGNGTGTGTGSGTGNGTGTGSGRGAGTGGGTGTAQGGGG